MADALGSYPQFRLNFEQQGKRAKELLKAARAGEPEALARFKSPPRLAEAQYLIARELRFDNWASLKRHIAAMTREREAAQAQVALPSDAPSLIDGEMRTLHVRCGGDIREPLQAAGFRGDFYEHNYPYLIGPVLEGPGALNSGRVSCAIAMPTCTTRRCNTRLPFTVSNTMNSGCTIPQTMTES